MAASGLASYAELCTVLTLEDAYKLIEILRVKQYHEWLANKVSQEKMENQQ
nr:MAG TPA: hypothetical protein [Caudoviricetes sp.]